MKISPTYPACADSLGTRQGRMPRASPGAKRQNYNSLAPKRQAVFLRPASYSDQMMRAFSSTFATRQVLVREIGRHSSISTRSPWLAIPSSTWAWYLAERVMILPYSGCLTRRSTRTVTVICILSLTTRPTSARRTFSTCSLIAEPPFRAGWCGRVRCRGEPSQSDSCCPVAGWHAACAAKTVPSAVRAALYSTLRRPWRGDPLPSCSTPNQTRNEHGLDRQLRGSKPERFA